MCTDFENVSVLVAQRKTIIIVIEIHAHICKIIEFYFSWNNRLALQEILDQKEIRCVCMHSLRILALPKLKTMKNLWND